MRPIAKVQRSAQVNLVTLVTNISSTLAVRLKLNAAFILRCEKLQQLGNLYAGKVSLGLVCVDEQLNDDVAQPCS